VSIRARSSKVQKAVGGFRERALKQARRDAVAAGELSNKEAALISVAEIPAEHRYSLNDQT
jgi:hypothetical protein